MHFGRDESMPSAIYEKVLVLCKQGNALVELKNYSEAIPFYDEALGLLPAPAEQWLSSDWLFVALGESYFFKTDFENAEMYLKKVCDREGAENVNPLVNLRRAQCLYKLNRLPAAAEQLRLSLVPYDISAFDDSFYWDIAAEITIRDDSLPFNC